MLRIVLIVNAVALNLYRYDNFQRPAAGMTVVAVMVVFTGFAIWAYAAAHRRVTWLLAVDLAVALAALVSSPLVKGAGFHASVPGFWITGALMAWAIHWRWKGGLVAATLLCGTDLAIRQDVSQTTYGHVFLLMIAGPIVGFLCGSLVQMAAERAAAIRTAAAAEERARLARAVHDGVLQVLALVQRRGPELGGEGADLGRLAGEQEEALRSLIRQQESLHESSGPRPAGAGATADLAAALEQLTTRRPPRVSVSTTGEPVLLDPYVVGEVRDAVAACLQNVAVHVGQDAPAWVLLEDLADRIVVTVRDEGPGIPAGRLDEAAGAGRLGVAQSIRGRIEDVGGSVSLFTAPGQGVEWELTVPRTR